MNACSLPSRRVASLSSCLPHLIDPHVPGFYQPLSDSGSVSYQPELTEHGCPRWGRGSNVLLDERKQTWTHGGKAMLFEEHHQMSSSA